MDIQKYIDSGALELYVLGQLGTEEAAEVKANAQLHPAIAAEIAAIEAGLEALAQRHAVTPPPGLLPGILAQLTPSSAPPAPAPHGTNWLPWVLAVLGISLASYFFWNLGQKDEEYRYLQQRYDQLELNCLSQDSVRLILAQQLNLYRDPEVKPIALSGTPLAPTATATVLHNPTAKKVFFAANNLPTPPPGKQYQLWALVEGNPVDLGVLSLQLGRDELTEVPYIENTGAYAITLEDLGGHPTPNLEQLYAIGNL